MAGCWTRRVVDILAGFGDYGRRYPLTWVRVPASPLIFAEIKLLYGASRNAGHIRTLSKLWPTIWMSGSSETASGATVERSFLEFNGFV